MNVGNIPVHLLVSIPQGPINTQAAELQIELAKLFQFRKVQLIPPCASTPSFSSMTFQFRKVQLIRQCRRKSLP